MSTFNRIGGRYGFHSGSGRVKNFQVDQNFFLQGSVLGQGCQGTIYYVDKTIANSGDGKSWDKAFKTVTLGIAALNDYDWLIIGPGNYNETGTLTLSGLKGTKILGYGTGMQWNEGSTVIGDEGSSNSDLLYITGCQAIEITGISFYTSGGTADAINFTGSNYSIHIHDCCFIGDVGGGAVMVNGIDIADNGADTYIHDCRFFRVKTAAIKSLAQRCVIKNNIFIVPNNGTGISGINRATAYNIIADNYFLGEGTGDEGILDTTMTAGNFMIVRNYFGNLSLPIDGATGGDANAVGNWDSGAGGVDVVVDPEA